jgi:hypothetical protein
MSKREKRGIDFTIGGTPFVGMWISRTEDMMHFGIKTGSRNVHVTMLVYDDILNCHITDEDRDPKKVWEMEIPVSDLEEIAAELMRTIPMRYRWFQTYYQLSPSLHDSMVALSEIERSKEFDMTRMLVDLADQDFVVKKRIRLGLRDLHNAGLLPKGDDLFIVFPMDKKWIFAVNSDVRRSPLWRVPTVQGMERYLDYVDEENVIETSRKFSPERQKQMRAAVLSVLADAGIADREPTSSSGSSGSDP